MIQKPSFNPTIRSRQLPKKTFQIIFDLLQIDGLIRRQPLFYEFAQTHKLSTGINKLFTEILLYLSLIPINCNEDGTWVYGGVYGKIRRDVGIMSTEGSNDSLYDSSGVYGESDCNITPVFEDATPSELPDDQKSGKSLFKMMDTPHGMCIDTPEIDNAPKSDDKSNTSQYYQITVLGQFLSNCKGFAPVMKGLYDQNPVIVATSMHVVLTLSDFTGKLKDDNIFLALFADDTDSPFGHLIKSCQYFSDMHGRSLLLGLIRKSLLTLEFSSDMYIYEALWQRSLITDNFTYICITQYISEAFILNSSVEEEFIQDLLCYHIRNHTHCKKAILRFMNLLKNPINSDLRLALESKKNELYTIIGENPDDKYILDRIYLSEGI